MKATKAINEYLGMTPEAHQDYILQAWLNWTENHAINTTHWQSLLANRAINRWFWIEVDKAHGKFMEAVARYDDPDTVTQVDFTRCYQRCMVVIFEIFPKPLVEACKPKDFPKAVNIGSGAGFLTALRRN